MGDADCDRIVEYWAREVSEAPISRGLQRAQILENMAGLVGALLRADRPALYDEMLADYVAARVEVGFGLPAVVAELRVLSRTVIRLCSSAPEGRGTEPGELASVQALLDEAIAAAVRMFHEYVLNELPPQRWYLRLLSTFSAEAFGEEHPERALLGGLALLVEASRADGGALWLAEPDGQRLCLRAAVGLGDALPVCQVPLDASTWEGALAQAVRPVELADAHAQPIAQSVVWAGGLRSLLGCRLWADGTLHGVVLVGRRSPGAQAPAVRRRLAALAAELARRLAAGTRWAALREQNLLLEREQELRQQFVMVLAHDLRGPLAAARMLADMMVARPETLARRIDLARRIVHNLDRTDRMVQDLLDVNRIQAGQPLPLRLERCELAELARRVLDELSALHGDRFALFVAEPVAGWWSPEYLERAIWNLVSNAVKYGDPQRKVEVRIELGEEGVRLAVHNEGPPIAEEDQELLFTPFLRTRSAETGSSRGWGLGLTLVRGCAESHGGSVEVRSAAGEGTTFTVRLPHDARPFQSER
jgi:signal transduction histidine kinase